MKHFIIILSIIGSLHAAEPSHQYNEWLAKEYAKGNKEPIKNFCNWLEKNRIDFNEKHIISFGCGTGEMEHEISKTAFSVHGIDASNNMILYAKKHYAPKRNNLSFQHCSAENFEPPKLYDIVLAPNCFHWFTDKDAALKRIHDCLDPNGRFFANIEVEDGKEPLGITVYKEMIHDIPYIGALLSHLPNPTGSDRPTVEELQSMLKKAHLDIIDTKNESYDLTMTKEEWRQYQLPILLSSLGAQTLINKVSDSWFIRKSCEGIFWLITMSEEEKEQHDADFFQGSSDELIQKIRENDFLKYLFNNFFTRFLAKLQKNNDETYTWKYETTIVLAQKG